MSDRIASRPPPVLPAKNPPKQPLPNIPSPEPISQNQIAPPASSQDITVAIDCQLPSNGPSYVKQARMYRIRDKVAHEILSTEKSYVESLNVVCDIWLAGLQASDVLSPEQLQALFSNIQVIRSFNKEFYHVLEDRLDKWEDSTTLADLFVKHAPFFRMYTQYVLNHDKAGDLLSELSKVNRFIKICEAIGKDVKVKGLELSSYLIMPIQRIPRYKLLLTELKKNTPEKHDDHKYLDSALDIVGKVAMGVNDAVKIHENRTIMINIQRQFTTDIDIVVPFRSFIRKGSLVKKCRSSDIEYEFILFNDLLIYASVTVAKSYKLHRKLPITKSFIVQDLRDDGNDRNRFQIVTAEKSFIVLVATPELKQTWLNDLYRCIAQQKMRINNEADVVGNDVAPVWQADSTSTNCSCCKSQFSFLKRRHHCRKCGSLVCNDCSKERVILKPNDEPKRICDLCVRSNRPTNGSSARPEDSTSMSMSRMSELSIIDLPPSPMAEHSRMDSVSVIDYAPALNAIAEDENAMQGEEKESSAEYSIPPPPPEEKAEDKSMDRLFPVYITTQESNLAGSFSLPYPANAPIRTYVIDAATSTGLGKLELDNVCEIGVFSMSHVAIQPGQVALKDHGYFITSSSTNVDFQGTDYLNDDLLMRYEPGHVILVADGEWEKADEANPWVNAYNATTRTEGCIPMHMRGRVLYSLAAFRDANLNTTVISPSAARPIPMVPTKPTATLHTAPLPESAASGPARPNYSGPEGQLSKPLPSIPAVPRKPTASLRSDTASDASQAPQVKVGNKPEGTGHCGMSSCMCELFVPNQFRKTICLTCRHNLSYHTV